MTTRVAFVLVLVGSVAAACSYTPPGGNGGSGGEGGGGSSSSSSSGSMATCGNGVPEAGEGCDDGNSLPNDGCSPDCQTEPMCGNNMQESGEECDDGNLLDGDGCSSSCQIEFGCGNDAIDVNEECDDGNVTNGDGCDANCTQSRCGNGAKAIDEECDDGNIINGDGCNAICFNEDLCGNNMMEQGELCDDGNENWNDQCSPSCVPLKDGSGCGNGITESSEPCDDGNTSNGDGCNATCTLTGESTIFVGMPQQPGNNDGVGTFARVGSGQYMTVFGDKLYLGKDQMVRVVDIRTKEVKRIAGAIADPGYVNDANGLNARFEWITGIATNGTTIWVADNRNHVIRAITIDSPHSVTTVAGVPEANMLPIPIADGAANVAKLGDMRGLTYLGGKVYFLEATAAVLRVFDPVAMTVNTSAGMADMTGDDDGYGGDARFRSPRYLTSDGVRMLYISDFLGYKIRAYDTMTGEVSTVAGTGSCGYVDSSGTTSFVHAPRGVAFDGTSLYFAESDAHTIRQVLPEKYEVSTLSGSPLPCAINCSCGGALPGGYAEGGPTKAIWNRPYDLAYHAGSRSLFVSDSDNFVIRRIK